MSRSKHTDPSSIRAARRLRAPREGRGVGDLRLRRQQGKMLKEVGAARILKRSGKRAPIQVKPRITVRRPRPGFHHAAAKHEILDVLDAIGPVSLYGLRSIELGRTRTGDASLMPAFASYHAPGRIVIYEQPTPPWRLRGSIAPETARRLKQAGAMLRPGVGMAIVEWPGETLRRFILDQVLMHEIGHHLLQHHKGKRLVRIARTGDHEAFAERFADKERARLAKRRGQIL
jgi:hypothetical protein